MTTGPAACFFIPFFIYAGFFVEFFGLPATKTMLQTRYQTSLLGV